MANTFTWFALHTKNFFNPLSAKKSKVTMLARASSSGFVVPYHFSISITGGIAFGQKKRVYMLYIYNTTPGT